MSNIKYIAMGMVWGAVAAIAGLSVYFISIQVVSANPSFFLRSVSSSVGTSTITYMTPGAATTTEVFDTGASGAGSVDSAVLAIQFTASSTASTLAWRYEYSQGGSGLSCVVTPDSCDWYPEDEELSSLATSTVHVRTFSEHTWLFASSTPGGAAVATSTSRATKMVNVPTPTRYVRAVFYVPAGSLNGAVWKEFISKRQSP